VQEVGADVVEVDALGGGFEQHPARVSQQPPRRLEHQTHHQEGGDGIGAGVAGGQDDDRGEHGAQEAIQVGEDVLVSARHVQAGPVRFGQHPGGEHVHRYSDDRHHQHRPALHRRGIEQPPDGLERHQRADHQQGDAVTGRGQDFQARGHAGVAVVGGGAQ